MRVMSSDKVPPGAAGEEIKTKTYFIWIDFVLLTAAIQLWAKLIPLRVQGSVI